MKVLLINGSPHQDGCTNFALETIKTQLKEEGVEADIIQVGHLQIHGCIACGVCHKGSKCVFDDIVNEVALKVKEYDGLIVGSPVYYASPNGTLISFLDRLFYSNKEFAFKPAAAITSARRAGTTSSMEVINKYFSIMQMPIISSSYWNMVHGNNKEEAMQDKEGIQTMQNLAKNMAWILKSIKAAEKEGITHHKDEKIIRTNFIR